MENRDNKKERFFMALFMVSYTGLFLAIFFWEMAGVSFVCNRAGISFRPALAILTVAYCILYFLRVRVLTVMDGFILCGSLAAGISSFFMGGGTGAWLVDRKFLIDLGVCTVSLIVMLTAVFFHSAGEFREVVERLESEEENSIGEDDPSDEQEK